MLALLCVLANSATAEPRGVVELRYRPAARAQIAVWLETADGEYVATLRLTEAVAYRGLGNRPGASQMNSGYRWPYGRREDVLPLWAARRASGPGAEMFPRVIFQDRSSEGRASRNSADFSPDNYYCLSFDGLSAKKDSLDAVSCASVFSSDKGRYLTPADVTFGYAEPYQDPETGRGTMSPLPLHSAYPPRMDVRRCSSAGCYDHRDVSDYADAARRVMPEIDAVTMATPQGGAEQSELWTVDENLPLGDYTLFMEINVEGDYNAHYSPLAYPTPTAPESGWDGWAINYGYPYRGQPSVLYEVPIRLAVGEHSYSCSEASGRSEWGPWSAEFGHTQADLDRLSDDPQAAPFSGADRLGADDAGRRLQVNVTLFEPPAEANPEVDPPQGPAETPPAPDGGEPLPYQAPASPHEESQVEVMEDPTGSDAVVLVPKDAEVTATVGMVRGLRMAPESGDRHGHDWAVGTMLAASSELPLHRYEVRVGNEPIRDELDFMQHARPAKTATEDAEGATSLKLPVDLEADTPIQFRIGDLSAQTRYFVAVRAVDIFNRAGPISVAEVTTKERVFTTVTPCFIATAAYGTPLAEDIGVLRRFRDRYLLTHAPGRLLVGLYYRIGPVAAEPVRGHDGLRHAVRNLISALVNALQQT